MNPKQLAIWFLLFFISGSNQIFAQIDVFEDEIENKNGVIYYENQVLNGTVYSNDEESIPNDCQCTLKAHYKNGLPDGQKLMFYNNGKLKFKGNYNNGKPVGEHIKYDKNGKIVEKRTFKNGIPEKVEFYKNGRVVKKESYNSGKLAIVQNFENDKLTAETQYFTDKEKYIEYYPNGKTKVEGYYKNKRKNGEWFFYDEAGEKTMKKIYLKDDLLGQGNYQNGQKNGIWYQYSPDKKIKTINKYKDGKLISSKVENSAYFIKNYNFKPDEKILYKKNMITGDSLYYVFNPMINTDDNEEVKQVKDVITAYLKRRADAEPSHLNPMISDKSISKRFEIHDVKITHTTVKHLRTRTVNGKQQNYYELEPVASVEFKIYVYTMDNSLNDIMQFHADSQGNLGTSLLAATLDAYPKNREEAFERMLKFLNIYKFLVRYFPAYTTIAEIKSQNSKKIKSIKTSEGYISNVLKGAHFKVYDKETKSFKSLIRIYKAESNFTYGKVKKDGEWLKNYISKDSHPWLKEFEY